MKKNKELLFGLEMEFFIKKVDTNEPSSSFFFFESPDRLPDRISPEIFDEQIELVSLPYNNLHLLQEDIVNLYNKATSIAKKNNCYLSDNPTYDGGGLNFSLAKPFPLGFQDEKKFFFNASKVISDQINVGFNNVKTHWKLFNSLIKYIPVLYSISFMFRSSNRINYYNEAVSRLPKNLIFPLRINSDEHFKKIIESYSMKNSTESIFSYLRARPERNVFAEIRCIDKQPSINALFAMVALVKSIVLNIIDSEESIAELLPDEIISYSGPLENKSYLSDSTLLKICQELRNNLDYSERFFLEYLLEKIHQNLNSKMVIGEESNNYIDCRESQFLTCLNIPRATDDFFIMPTKKDRHIGMTNEGLVLNVRDVFFELSRLSSQQACLVSPLPDILKKLENIFLKVKGVEVYNISSLESLFSKTLGTKEFVVIFDNKGLSDSNCIQVVRKLIDFFASKKTCGFIFVASISRSELFKKEHVFSIYFELIARYPELLELATFNDSYRDYQCFNLIASKVVNYPCYATKELLVNKIKKSLCHIPKGTSIVGSADDEEGRWQDEGPCYKKEFQQFYMMSIAVTNKIYMSYLKLSGSSHLPPFIFDNRFNSPQQPVVGLSIAEIIEMAHWLQCKLPNEEQWEYACRANSDKPRYGELESIAFYQENSRSKTQEVGLKSPNAFGLYDMIGNVWELTISDRSDFVLRGGSWADSIRTCRAATRLIGHPGPRFANQGFRFIYTSKES